MLTSTKLFLMQQQNRGIGARAEPSAPQILITWDNLLHSRNSPATFWSPEYGIFPETWTNYGANEVRLITLSSSQGYLAEKNTINHFTASENFANSDVWTALGAIVTSNVTSAPDDNNTADQISIVQGSNARRIEQHISGTANNDNIVTSIWVKSTGSAAAVRLLILKRDGTTVDSGDLSVTGSEWRRLSFSTNIGSGSTQPIFSLRSDLIGSGGDFYIWGAQAEKLTYPTTYVSTSNTGSASRPIDFGAITTTTINNSDWDYNGIRWKITFLPGWDYDELDQIRRFFQFGTGNNTLEFSRIGANTIVRVVADSISAAATDALTFTKGQELTFTFEPLNGEITVEGATTGNGTYYGSSWQWPATGSVSVRVAQAANNTAQINGILGEPILAPHPFDGGGENNFFLLDYNPDQTTLTGNAKASFLRASSATYRESDFGGSSGTVVHVTASQQRRLADGSVILEGSRTNLIPFSENMSGTGWAAAGADVTYTNNDAGIADPDGGSDADRVQHSAGSGNFGPAEAQSLTSGQKVAVSTFVRGHDGTAQNFRVALGTLAGSSGSTNSDGSWLRTKFVHTPSVTTSSSVLPEGRADTPTTGDLELTSDLDYWGWQFEDNVQFASSYIRTTGSTATRLGDDLSFPDVPGWMRTKMWAFDFWPEFGSADGVTGTYLLYTFTDNTKYIRYRWTGAAWVLETSDGTTARSSSMPAWSAGDQMRTTIKPAAGQITVKNVTTGDIVIGTTGSAQTFPGGNTLYVGQTITGVSQSFARISRPWRSGSA